jgi:hypothetical protein
MLKSIRKNGAQEWFTHKVKSKMINGLLKIGLLLLCCSLFSIISPNIVQSAEEDSTPSTLTVPTGLRIVSITDDHPDAGESENNEENKMPTDDSAEVESTHQQIEAPKNFRIVIEY